MKQHVTADHVESSLHEYGSVSPVLFF